MTHLTERERAAAHVVFAQYALTAPELATACSELPAAVEARAAVKRASPINFQGEDVYYAAHTVAARIASSVERERVHWSSDPAHSVGDWQGEVANGDTRLGYWDWVAVQKELD